MRGLYLLIFIYLMICRIVETHGAKHMKWGNLLQEHDENPNNTYFKEQCDQQIPLDVCFVTMCMQLKRPMKRDAIHI
jgi:hypothetical protein